MKFEIMILFIINLVSGAGYSLVSPLFPSIAVKIGLSDSAIGFIISSYAIANLIATPFSRKIFHLIGKKNVLFYAVVIEVI
jgi:MFS family permease